MRKLRFLGYYAVLLTIVSGIIIGVVLVVQVLWNLVMTDIMLCDRISFLQSAGLVALVSILAMDKTKLFSWLNEE